MAMFLRDGAEPRPASGERPSRLDSLGLVLGACQIEHEEGVRGGRL